MKQEPLILSSAYFPPSHYMSLVAATDKILIEREENYIKQTFRNRCIILSANGILTLSVPILEGSFHKRAIKDIRIDYSKKWQQIHLRSIYSAYKAAPYFDYYYDKIENIILKGYLFLLDLNMATLKCLKEFFNLPVEIYYTSEFKAVKNLDNDTRYFLNPKNPEAINRFKFKQYIQVFSSRFKFVSGLSSLDLLFNTGPDAISYLPEFNLYDK